MYVRLKGSLEGCLRLGVRRESWPRRRCIPRTHVAPRECYRVLGIESSCDDTGVAVVENGGVVIAEKLATQAEIHAHWGGVVPRLAQEAHQAAMEGLIREALSQTAFLDAVAVTVGPGLSLCLRVRHRSWRSLQRSVHGWVGRCRGGDATFRREKDPVDSDSSYGSACIGVSADR